MSDTPELCPDCGKPTERIEVDIGVGVQRGPAECFHCGWGEQDAMEEWIEPWMDPEAEEEWPL